MNKKMFSSLLTILILSATVAGLAQSKKQSAEVDEIERLKKELEMVTARANTAEKYAREAEVNAAQLQRLAERESALAKKMEAMATRCRYIAQAKLMALKSRDIQGDTQQQALVAGLAYKFNLNYQGDPKDSDIHDGLYKALVALKEPAVKSQPETISNEKLAELICGHLTRNMTKEEWITYVGSDLPYEVVCTK